MILDDDGPYNNNAMGGKKAADAGNGGYIYN